MKPIVMSINSGKKEAVVVGSNLAVGNKVFISLPATRCARIYPRYYMDAMGLPAMVGYRDDI